MSTLWMIFLIVFGLLRRSFGRAGAGLGSRIGRRPTAKRPKVLDANPVRGMLLAAERGCWRRRGAVGGGEGLLAVPPGGGNVDCSRAGYPALDR
jgi:hypothetical protein